MIYLKYLDVIIRLCQLIHFLEEQLKHEANTRIYLWITEEIQDLESPSPRIRIHAPFETRGLRSVRSN